ncbi:MAG: hypothetical protein AAGA48_28575 [Myxococcota bacterium]
MRRFKELLHGDGEKIVDGPTLLARLLSTARMSNDDANGPPKEDSGGPDDEPEPEPPISKLVAGSPLSQGDIEKLVLEVAEIKRDTLEIKRDKQLKDEQIQAIKRAIASVLVRLSQALELIAGLEAVIEIGDERASNPDGFLTDEQRHAKIAAKTAQRAAVAKALAELVEHREAIVALIQQWFML